MSGETPEEVVPESESQAPEGVTPAAESDAAVTEAAAEAPAAPVAAEPAAPEEAVPEAPSEAVGTVPELTIGSGAVTEVEAEYAPVVRGKIDRFGVAMGTGRRKTSVARVRIKQGSGELTINNRPLSEYFSVERDRLMVEAPLRATDSLGKVNVWVRVNGGGTTGQTGAIILGIARALEAMDPSNHYALAHGGYLTRDSRMVERKKYGFKKARKSFQFSKR